MNRTFNGALKGAATFSKSLRGSIKDKLRDATSSLYRSLCEEDLAQKLPPVTLETKNPRETLKVCDRASNERKME